MPKKGRPPVENPKSNPVHVRFSEDEMRTIEEYSTQENITKTEAIRAGVHLLEREIKNG